ncbi:hypothetical protein B9G54_02770 [Alloscardovia macacae]|uniref:NlpC/P60 domain-containing protein n=1 Tax=Alloscardovia macacae TaxID=1160091 RepID=A0A1Y2T0C5_9BIFI|nr:hypothetical protein B9G54_02770 [Alloscardovia macacae]OTA30044.1 hypothetical protein B9T39_01380 [Alloscardovia macacae]
MHALNRPQYGMLGDTRHEGCPKRKTVLSTGKHRVSSASAPVTPFNTQSAFVKASRLARQHMTLVKAGTIAVSSLLVMALAHSAAPTFATATGSDAATGLSVSRSSSRADLTAEVATINYVQGEEWDLSADSSSVNITYQMTDEQKSARENLIQTYNAGQTAFGSTGSASDASRAALSAAMNNASAHLQDESTAVDTYNADIASLKQTIAKVQSEQASAVAAAAAASRAATANAGASSSSSSVDVGTATGTAADLINYAMSFVGTPYLWGGTTTAGWDCSGFTSYVFRKFGINLPRTSGAQATVGTPVASLAEAQPGDIIANGTHAAIYIGNGKVVNALNSNLGTKVTNMSVFTGGYSIRRVL